MCWLKPKQCRRTKGVCDKPECRALWRQHETEAQRTAVAQYHRIIEDIRRRPPEGVPEDTTVH